jgi:hypothetical protein
MKKYEYVLFNNYDYCENHDSAREWLFATRQDDFDWEMEDDVPEKMILDEMSFLEDSEWAYFKSKCEELLSDGDCLLTGTCGRWNGSARGGKFIHNFHDLVGCIEHLDYLKIIDRNGHLIIEGCHHDGSDYYEIKKLTKHGQKYAQQWGYVRDERLHRTIMSFNFYSKLPRLATI